MTGAFFSLAPLWVSHCYKVFGYNLFLRGDAIQLFGVTLLVSLLGYYLLPDFLTPRLKSRDASPESRSAGARAAGHRLLAIGALIGLVYGLYQVNQHILHSFLSSADEHSCYFLAECLRRGRLYADIPPFADFFEVVHVGMKGGKWFSVYPPGWPVIWAMGLNLNIVDWLNPAMSALAVFVFYRAGIRIFSRSSVVCGLFLCISSPFFAFTAASYFSHATSLLCVAVFLYSFLRWREGYAEGKDPVGWAILCGLGVGYGLITRPLTMFALAGPFLLYHFLPCFINTECFKRASGIKRANCFRFALRRSDWVFLSMIGFFLLIGILQNFAVTGKPFKSPLKYYQSWERLGFKRGHYTPVDGFFYGIARIFYLMDWFAPAAVGAYLFLLANTRCLKDLLTPGVDRVRLIFRFAPVFLAFAYFLYYSWGGNQWGPRYWWEGLPFLSIAAGGWITARWNAGSIRTRKFLVVFVVASLASSAVLFVKHAGFTSEASSQRRALYDHAERTIEGPAIVFISGFLGSRLVLAEEDAVRNSPFLDGRILYAHDLGERNKELIAAWPGREYYRGIYDRERLRSQIERIR